MDINELRRRAGISVTESKKPLREYNSGGTDSDAAIVAAGYEAAAQALRGAADQLMGREHDGSIPPELEERLETVTSEVYTLANLMGKAARRRRGG